MAHSACVVHQSLYYIHFPSHGKKTLTSEYQGHDWGGGGGGEHRSRGQRPLQGGGCGMGMCPLSAKLKPPPFYKVNGKLKRGPLQQ